MVLRTRALLDLRFDFVTGMSLTALDGVKDVDVSVGDVRRSQTRNRLHASLRKGENRQETYSHQAVLTVV